MTGPHLGDISEVTQTILYSAELNARGVYGNCLQAAIASALGIDLEAVPHVGAFTWWEPAARLWLRGIGLDWRMVSGIPAGRSIVVGPTVRETGNHAVVGDGGRIVWDPHPSRAGLTSVKFSYVLEEWPGEQPSGCVCCGAPAGQLAGNDGPAGITVVLVVIAADYHGFDPLRYVFLLAHMRIVCRATEGENDGSLVNSH